MPRSSSSEQVEKLPTEGLVGGKYEIVRLIGRGGMGSVWEARHATLGTRVAIKFVDVEQARNDEARHRFQNEARAAATIESKHAIKVHDHGFLEDGRPYIVMELLAGEPLDRRLDRLGRMPLRDTARIVQQVARALQQAHDAGITHRDLKPDNIFLVQSPDDDDEIAKVLDFGIAKITDPAHALGVSSSTKTGVLMGTPFYMSPEQARGLKTVDYRSDLWALAIIVFRCVTGVLPFTGEALGDLLVKICASPVPVPSTVLPGLSPELDAWMVRALEREPEQRFQSARELAESLAIVAGITVRLGSRRSSDSFPPAHVAPKDLTVQASSVPRSDPRDAPALAGSPDALARPVAMVTSSPITASSPPPPRPRSAVNAVAVSLIAGAALIAAAGVTTVMTRRTSPVTSPAANLVSAVAVPVPSALPSAIPPVPEEPPPAPSAAPSAATRAHAPASTSKPAARPVVPVAPKRPALTAAPPPVSIPKPAPPPPPPPGNDPGY